MTRLALVALVLLVPLVASADEADPAAEFARLTREAVRLHGAGSYADAEPLFRQALAIVEGALGPSHPLVATTLNNLALTVKARGDLSGARPLYERALAIDEATYGPRHPDLAPGLNNLANLLTAMGEYAAARALYERALDILETAPGSQDDRISSTLTNLGLLLKMLGDHAGARPLYERALALKERALGPAHPETAASLNNLAVLLQEMADYEGARALLERALASKQQALGPLHPDVAIGANNLAALLKATGDYRGAEPLYARALAIWERTLGPEHPAVAIGLTNQASMLETLGEPAAARPLYERALAIRERALGADHPDVAVSLGNLAAFLQNTGDAAGARRLYERALAITERALGAEHPDLVTPLGNLGQLLKDLGDAAGARRHLDRALAISMRAHGPDHPDVAGALNNLGGLMLATGDVRGARAAHERALAIREATLGPDHPDIATSLGNLATAGAAAGDLSTARPLLERALAISKQALGDDHRDVASLLTALAALHDALGDLERARHLYERARRIYLRVSRTGLDVDDQSHRAMLEVAHRQLRGYARVLARLARGESAAGDASPAALVAFVVAEQARGGTVQRALTQASARAAAADPDTARLAREVQDLRQRRRAVWRELTVEYGKPRPDAMRVAALRVVAVDVDRELTAGAERLRRAFPRLAELVAPEPIDAATVQTLLGPREAVLSYFSLPDRLLAWVIRPGRAPVYRDLEISRADLRRSVARVREGVDQSANPDLARGRLRPFDVEEAHRLYKVLLQPFEDALAGVTHLLVVPDDALVALPFSALVTRADGEAWRAMTSLPMGRAVGEELSGYRDLAWLARTYAISVLPSATALRAVRQRRPTVAAAGEPLIAFGDPVLHGHGRQRGGRMPTVRGGAVATEDLRQMPALPGTREELLAIARALGADPGRALYLGTQATKPVVMALNTAGRLGRAQVLAFATHGLMAGEMTEGTEPALVLTPPATRTEGDDGLLTLDDVLRFRLTHTDWVVLSACNTAADDGSGENLSGLARGFHFAGAPALLVSHWSVDDQATRTLMTGVFERYARERPMPRAEAVRRGMLALIESARGDRAYFAHPFAWAPFFVVGDGAGGAAAAQPATLLLPVQAPTIAVTVTLFADLRRFLPKGVDGPQRYELGEGATVTDLLRAIGIEPESEVTAAVDGELAARETALRDGASVMLLSPMEGG